MTHRPVPRYVRETVATYCRIPRDQHEELKAWAEARGVSITTAITLALPHGIAFLRTWGTDPAGLAEVLTDLTGQQVIAASPGDDPDVVVTVTRAEGDES